MWRNVSAIWKNVLIQLYLKEALKWNFTTTKHWVRMGMIKNLLIGSTVVKTLLIGSPGWGRGWLYNIRLPWSDRIVYPHESHEKICRPSSTLEFQVQEYFSSSSENVKCYPKEFVFDKNYNFLIPLYLLLNVVDLRYFKLIILFDQIIKFWNTKGLHYQILKFVKFEFVPIWLLDRENFLKNHFPALLFLEMPIRFQK